MQGLTFNNIDQMSSLSLCDAGPGTHHAELTMINAIPSQ